MGHVGLKTRSLGKMVEKNYVYSRDHIFSPITTKVSQNFCDDEISKEFENGSCQIKNMATRSNLRKIMCTL